MHHCWHILPKKRLFPHHSRQRLTRDDRIVFSTSGVDLEQFPFATWAKLSRQVLSSKQEKLLQSPPAMGLYELRVANCGSPCGRFGIFMRHRSKFWWVPVRNICWGFWLLAAGCVPPLCRGRTRLFQGQTHLRSNGASVIDVPMDEKWATTGSPTAIR